MALCEKVLKIDGMSCGHCVMRVKKALDQLPGVSQSDIEIGTAKVRYDESTITSEEVTQAVERAGYKVVE